MSYEYGENIKTIEKITFIPYGNKLVKKNSEIAEELGIIHPVSYENGEAKKNGIVDPRLGVTEHFTQCETCGLRNIECPGHFGHTELVEPIFHMGFLTVVKSILSFVCLSCAKIRIGKNIADVKEMLKYNSSEVRFNKMKKLTENLKHCIHCEEPLPKIKIDKNKQKMTTLLIAESLISDADAGGEENKKKKEIIDAQRAYDILRNISDEDCILMGLNPMVSRPADFIIKTFPISPNAIRPTIRADFAAASAFENPITHLISSIVKNTKRFREQKEKKKEGKQDTLRDFNQLVQHNISTYFDNEASGQYRSELKTGGKPLKGMSERLKGKGGRIRNNLMGKRVNFSARTVITSDPNLDLDELGMPLRIAMNLTIPEVVTPNNITKLSKLVSNGRNVYPGANYVLKKNRSYGRRNLIDLRYQNKTNHKLQYGDVVERHMLDGDVVLFNRQPSLHKLSMMSHRIRVINDLRYNTFRMNVNVTPPYNADFDGKVTLRFI